MSKGNNRRDMMNGQLMRIKSSITNQFVDLSRKFSANTTYSHPVFGVPLDEHLRSSGRDVALVLEVCVGWLLNDLEREGLFRVPGSLSKVKKLKATFDARLWEDPSLALSPALTSLVQDVDVTAGCLKCYLRTLPQPLLTYALYDEWIKAAKMSDTNERLQALWSVCRRLSGTHYTNLRYLVKFLSRVAKHADENKMSPLNIAIAVGPSLIWPPPTQACALQLSSNGTHTSLSDESHISEGSIGMNITATNYHTIIVEALVSYADYFFPGEVEFARYSEPSPSEEVHGDISMSESARPLSMSGLQSRTANSKPAMISPSGRNARHSSMIPATEDTSRYDKDDGRHSSASTYSLRTRFNKKKAAPLPPTLSAICSAPINVGMVKSITAGMDGTKPKHETANIQAQNIISKGKKSSNGKIINLERTDSISSSSTSGQSSGESTNFSSPSLRRKGLNNLNAPPSYKRASMYAGSAELSNSDDNLDQEEIKDSEHVRSNGQFNYMSKSLNNNSVTPNIHRRTSCDLSVAFPCYSTESLDRRGSVLDSVIGRNGRLRPHSSMANGDLTINRRRVARPNCPPPQRPSVSDDPKSPDTPTPPVIAPPLPPPPSGLVIPKISTNPSTPPTVSNKDILQNRKPLIPDASSIKSPTPPPRPPLPETEPPPLDSISIHSIEHLNEMEAIIEACAANGHATQTSECFVAKERPNGLTLEDKNTIEIEEDFGAITPAKTPPPSPNTSVDKETLVTITSSKPKVPAKPNFMKSSDDLSSSLNKEHDVIYSNVEGVRSMKGPAPPRKPPRLSSSSSSSTTSTSSLKVTPTMQVMPKPDVSRRPTSPKPEPPIRTVSRSTTSNTSHISDNGASKADKGLPCDLPPPPLSILDSNHHTADGLDNHFDSPRSSRRPPRPPKPPLPSLLLSNTNHTQTGDRIRKDFAVSSQEEDLQRDSSLSSLNRYEQPSSLNSEKTQL